MVRNGDECWDKLANLRGLIRLQYGHCLLCECLHNHTQGGAAIWNWRAILNTTLTPIFRFPWVFEGAINAAEILLLFEWRAAGAAVRDVWWWAADAALRNLELSKQLSLSYESLKFFEIHCFEDASETVYAAAVYITGDSGNAKASTLVYAKSGVCPVKPLTIPRLELLAVLIGSRAMNLNF